MKTFHKNLSILLLCVCALLQHACISSKATATNYTVQTNNRQKISGARFERSINWLGIGTTLGLGAAGAYIGSKSDLVSRYDATGNPHAIKPAGAAIGAFTGLGLGLGVNLLIKGKPRRKIESESDARRWTRKWNANYTVIPGSYNRKSGYDYQFEMVRKDANQNWVFNQDKDFDDYRKVFSTSDTYFPAAVLRSPLDNRKLENLLQTYPNAFRERRLEMLEKMARQCHTAHELTDLAARNPDATSLQNMAFGKCNSLEDYRFFAEKFPLSRLQAAQKALSNCRTITEYCDYAVIFPDKKTEAGQFALAAAQTIPELKKVSENFPDQRTNAGQKAETNAKSLDETLQLVQIFPERTSSLLNTAIRFGKTTADFVAIGNVFQESKPLIGEKAQNAAGSLSEVFLAATNFPDRSNNLSRKACQFARTVTDWASIAKHFPEMTDKAREEARQIPGTVAGFIELGKNFPELKEEAITRAIEHIDKLADITQLAANFPELKPQLGPLAMEYAGNISEWMEIASNFPDNRNYALSQALNNCRNMDDCQNIATNYPVFARSAKIKATRFVSSYSDLERYDRMFYGSLTEFKELDLLEAAAGRMNLYDQVRFSHYLENYASGSFGNGKTTFVYYVPAASFGVITMMDVLESNLSVDIWDSRDARVDFENYLNLDGMDNFNARVLCMGAGAKGMAVKVTIQNSSWASGRLYTHHISALDIPNLTALADSEAIGDWMVSVTASNVFGEALLHLMGCMLMNKTGIQCLKDIIIDLGFAEYEREGGENGALKETFIREVLKNVK